jgi:NAD(P)-dependent dehydrogenase (short-subunit alcohol dehydrogenase family)
MAELDGRVVLVVGASGGLGSRLVAELDAAGATVLSASRSSPASLDLRDPQSIRDYVGALSVLDGVIVAAGVVAFGPADQVSDAVLAELFAANAVGPITLIRELTPLLAESAAAGRTPFIATLSGIVAESPTAGLAAYSASKSALAAFVSAASRELRRAGIRVLDARPGHTETDLSRHPIAGAAPAFPPGLDPATVASRIVQAIVADEKDLPGSAFA